MRFAALVVAAVLGADGVRTRNRRSAGRQTTKFIEGVPVLNYDKVGESLAEGESEDSQKWVVVVKSRIGQAVMRGFCRLIKCTQQGHPEKGGVPFFEVQGSESRLGKFLMSRAVRNQVRFIEPDSKAYAIPEFEASAAPSWGLDRVGASKRANEGSGVHIYVLDTGVRASHGDFGGRVVPTLDMSTGDRVLCTEGQAMCTNDAQGHGTHCAGTTAGTTYGVAPKATVHAVKVLSDSGSGSWSWSYSALDYMATDGLRPAVASMSLGGAGTQSAMADAVNAAVDAGVVVVVAGGNENSDSCGFSPAFIDSAITVGSTTSTDSRSPFSNYGACTNIWAPGSDITSAAHTSDTGSATFSGTSMACPHVSGASALLLEKDASLSSYEVLTSLLSTAEDGVISDLKTNDINRLLYVGADAVPAPPMAPTPAPPAPPPAPKCVSGCSKRFCSSYPDLCGGCSFC